MRVHADRSVCVGAGMCALTAPAVFDQGDDGTVHPLLTEPVGPQRDAAREAADACPSGALSVTD